jgi:hypothetical protein
MGAGVVVKVMKNREGIVPKYNIRPSGIAVFTAADVLTKVGANLDYHLRTGPFAQ